MHVHILGICGTFMGGIAVLAKQMGFRVSGSDQNVYPPMSDQLRDQGIELIEGYDPGQFQSSIDIVVIGNALSRGNSAVEYVLNNGLRYISGPQFLSEYVLREKWCLAVSGTHGKTSTSSILTWILEYAGMAPGFLVGGVPQNFGLSARLGDTPFFVVEADEYDTAFFDKRSKFVHYRPRTLIVNNVEFDHADIFDSIDDIIKQFHHLIRTVPATGLVVAPSTDQYVARILELGCWTPVHWLGAGAQQGSHWRAEYHRPDGSSFTAYCDDQRQGEVNWECLGDHNVNNALAAIAAARHAGVKAEAACAALAQFKNVKRRLEIRGTVKGVTVYDDFAHHPTAIATTLDGLRKRVGEQRILAIIEPRSNTMRLGIHKDELGPSLSAADKVYCLSPGGISWDVAATLGQGAQVFDSVDRIVQAVVAEARASDHVLVMSNGAFGGIHDKLLRGLGQA